MTFGISISKKKKKSLLFVQSIVIVSFIDSSLALLGTCLNELDATASLFDKELNVCLIRYSID